MSWQIFKDNILRISSTPDSIQSIDQIAEIYAIEYDSAIKRGTETINHIPLLKGNVDTMKQLFKLAFFTGQASIVPFDLVGALGPGVLSYWQGAELNKSPIPITPALGAAINIGVTSATCTNPGQWTLQTPLPPNNNSSLLVDLFIATATAHLQTVSGVVNTVSLYPPLLTPGPGILNWSGYFVPPSKLGGVGLNEPSTEQLLQSIPNDNNTFEGAKEVVSETGVEILTDGGEDAGDQLNQIKEELPDDIPPTEPLSEEEAIFKTESDASNIQKDNTVEPTQIKCGGGSINYDAQLTQNYRLRDLSIGCMFPHRIKAQVGLSEQQIICNLQNLAFNIIEPLKAKYPNMKINSAFRGTPSISGGVSQHQKGEAVDVQFVGVPPRGYVAISNWCRVNLPFDQIIFEHGNSIWLHISCKKDLVQRKQFLTMYKGHYQSGLVCYYS